MQAVFARAAGPRAARRQGPAAPVNEAGASPAGRTCALLIQAVRLGHYPDERVFMLVKPPNSRTAVRNLSGRPPTPIQVKKTMSDQGQKEQAPKGQGQKDHRHTDHGIFPSARCVRLPAGVHAAPFHLLQVLPSQGVDRQAQGKDDQGEKG
jgi:hypothetical protein